MGSRSDGRQVFRSVRHGQGSGGGPRGPDAQPLHVLWATFSIIPPGGGRHSPAVLWPHPRRIPPRCCGTLSSAPSGPPSAAAPPSSMPPASPRSPVRPSGGGGGGGGGGAQPVDRPKCIFFVSKPFYLTQNFHFCFILLHHMTRRIPLQRSQSGGSCCGPITTNWTEWAFSLLNPPLPHRSGVLAVRSTGRPHLTAFRRDVANERPCTGEPV